MRGMNMAMITIYDYCETLWRHNALVQHPGIIDETVGANDSGMVRSLNFRSGGLRGTIVDVGVLAHGTEAPSAMADLSVSCLFGVGRRLGLHMLVLGPSDKERQAIPF